MKSIIKLILLTLIILSACSKKGEPGAGNESRKVNLVGHVEKGPFIQGSSITVYELNDQFIPTGKSFKTEILDDKGSFNLKGLEISAKYVQITANGYYFDELTAQLSKSTISLNAIAEVNLEKTINVNVLTHLEEKRVKKLIQEGKKFADAKIEAQKELYKSFHVKENVNVSSSENISFMQNNMNSTVLYGVSAILLKIAESNEAKLTELLSVLSQDLEDDGVLKEDNREKVKGGIESLNGEILNENIKSRYKELSVDISDFKFLEVFQLGFNGSGNSITPSLPSEIDLLMMFNSIVSNHYNFTQHYFFIEGLYTKTINDASFVNNVFYKQELTGNESDLSTLHSNTYKVLMQYNYIIKTTDEFKDSNTALIIKEKSSTLLAYAYWQGMNVFGNPFYVHPENFDDMVSSLARTNKDVVARDLIARLENSIDQLSGQDDKMADFTRLVAAKLYIDLKDYMKANTLIIQIIDGNRYTLSAKNNALNESKEIIFGEVFNLDNDQNLHYNFSKFAKKGNYLSLGRYTEVLLLASELNLKLNNAAKALDYLNLVRERNGKQKLSSTTSIIENIHSEYKEDLKNEGVYFSFLKRNDLAKETLDIEGFRQLFPIPLRDIATNPAATQNPGYN